MSSDLVVHQFPPTGQPIRVIERDGEPWFVAADVCVALNIANVGGALLRLDQDERDSIRLADGTPGNPTKGIVNEAGLYSLILRSDKPQAKAFKRWITHEVLPSIRKTGGYVIPRQLTPAELILQQAQQLVDHEQKIAKLDGEVTVLGARVDGIEQRTGWFVALAYAKIHHLPADTTSLQRFGKEAARIARRDGIEPGKVPNERYGFVNSYPEEIWQEAAAIFQKVAR